MPVTEVPSYVVLSLMKDIISPAGTIALTEAFYTGDLERKTFYVKTTGNCNVYPLGGPDADSCNHVLVAGTVCDTEDSARAWTVNNAAKCFQVIEHFAYMRLVVENNAGADVTVNASLS